MFDYKLQIQVCSIGTVSELNMRSKYNSLFFVDYSPIVEDILYCFKSDKDLNLFRFELYTTFQDSVKISKYNDGYKLNSDIIDVSSHCLAICLPREIRKRFFKWDSFYEKYVFLDSVMNKYCFM